MNVLVTTIFLCELIKILTSSEDFWSNVTSVYRQIDHCDSYLHPDGGKYLCLAPRSLSLPESCWCDSLCYEQGDCCLDKITTDSDRVNGSFSCFPFQKSHKYDDRIRTVADCQGAWPRDRTRRFCEDRFDPEADDLDVFAHTLPVRSEVTGVFYKNIYCAICNRDDANLSEWLLKFDSLKCDERASLGKLKFNSFDGTWSDRNCVYQIVNFDHYLYRPCGPERSDDYVSTCSDSTSPYAPFCPRYFAPVFAKNTERFFRNIYCYLCNHAPLQSDLQQLLGCGFHEKHSYSISNTHVDSDYPWLQMEFKSVRVPDFDELFAELELEPPPICASDEIFVEGFFKCMSLSCSFKKMFYVPRHYYSILPSGRVLLFNGMKFSARTLTYSREGRSRFRVCAVFLKRPNSKNCETSYVRSDYFSKLEVGHLLLKNNVSVSPADIMDISFDKYSDRIVLKLCRELLDSFGSSICFRGLVRIIPSTISADGFVLNESLILYKRYDGQGNLEYVEVCADVLFPDSYCDVTQIEVAHFSEISSNHHVVLPVLFPADEVLLRQFDYNKSRLHSVVVCAERVPALKSTYSYPNGNNGKVVYKFDSDKPQDIYLNFYYDLPPGETFSSRHLENCSKDLRCVLMQLPVHFVEKSFGDTLGSFPQLFGSELELPSQLDETDTTDSAMNDDVSYKVRANSLVLDPNDIFQIHRDNDTVPNISVYMNVLQNRTIRTSNAAKSKIVSLSKGSGKVLKWLTFVSLTLSVVCLCIHLVVYAMIPSLRNTPGKILMSLSASLITADILFLLSPLFEKKSVGCHAVAVLIHYFYLTVFSWTNVLSLTFYKLSFIVKGNLPFLKYSLYAWSLPAVIVLTTELGGYLSGMHTFYGGDLCWITNKLALLLSFTLPVSFALIINVVFFALTAKNMNRRAREVKRAKGLFGKQRFALYVKFVAILGFTWALGLVAAFSGVGAFWYPFVVLSGLQGVYVFVVFICKRRIWRLLVASFRKKRNTFLQPKPIIVEKSVVDEPQIVELKVRQAPQNRLETSV